MMDFNSTTALIVVNGFEIFLAMLNLFLIFTIWKKSPQVMGSFKWYMLKMAYILTFGAAACTLTAVNDCCYYRAFMFYNKDKQLAILTTFPHALIYGLILNGYPFIYLTGVLFGTGMNYEELAEYARERHYEKYLALITPKTSFHCVNFDKLLTVVVFALMGAYLVAVLVLNMIASSLVVWKIYQLRATMSTDTFRLQKSLNIVLISQAVIPFIAMIFPFFVLLLSVSQNAVILVAADWFQWLLLSMFGLYPLINTLFCLSYVKPYRDFSLKLLKKALFCFKFPEAVLVSAAPSGSEPSNLTHLA